jgi:S1-C subfamily serine protease
MLTWQGALPVAVTLVASFVLPMVVDAQQTQTMIVQPPTGWFGVRISDKVLLDDHGNAFFDSYPVITGVDSASPAEKAGVQPGDILLTFNSHDMRGGTVQLSNLLKAGSPFVLRIRRNEQTRVVRGILGKRPPNWEQKMVVELTVPEIMEQRTGSIARAPLQRTVVTRSGMPSPEPFPAMLAPALGYGGGVYPFAGAEFTALNKDLCDALGVKPEGVFVTNVIEGSAARTAGLRGGDVITKADNIKIDGPIDLVRAIRAADETDRTLNLQIIRKRKPETLALRW